MRFRAQRFAFLAVPAAFLACVACSDDRPVYPPIVINIIGGGADGVGNATSSGDTTSTGDQPSSTGGSSSDGGSSTGGSNTGGSSTGGSSSTGAGGLLAHCGNFWSGQDPPVKTQCDLANLKDGGDVKGDISADTTLKSGNFYTLKGVVRVMQDKTLTIEPCVKIMGADPSSVLVVLSSALGNPTQGCSYPGGTMTHGGKLMAVGEPMAPIIFTSSKPVGHRAASDWGGVLLLGNAFSELAAPNVRVGAEGLVKTECYGYHTTEFNDESSGDLEYARIEYASQSVASGSETNGLTLAGQGTGTVVRYVQVGNSGDDCFEWFGGVMNADHLVAYNCDDDTFDMDTGFSGHLQNLFGRQDIRSTEDNSFAYEVGSNKNTTSSAQISNTTQCGSGAGVVATNQRGGVYALSSPNWSLMNTFLTGFTTKGGPTLVAGIDVSPTAIINSTHMFNQVPPFAEAGKAVFDAGMGNSLMPPDRFCNCWANPPVPVAATATPGLKPTGFQDETASYVGAFPDASPDTNWMKGLWIDWSNN